MKLVDSVMCELDRCRCQGKREQVTGRINTDIESVVRYRSAVAKMRWVAEVFADG